MGMTTDGTFWRCHALCEELTYGSQMIVFLTDERAEKGRDIPALGKWRQED
jgi:hypothetical protein